jgi:hypothetical protein
MFPGFPQPFGKVTEQGLEEKDETHPLVIRVVLLLPFVVIHVLGDTRMGHTVQWAVEGIRHREGGHNPAISVHDVGRHPVHDAPYRLTHELRPCDDHGKGNQEDGREGAVYPEDWVVDDNLLPLEVVLQAGQQIIHFDELPPLSGHTTEQKKQALEHFSSAEKTVVPC